MYITCICCYPNHKSKEVAERYVQAMKKFPDDPEVMVSLIPSALKATREGIEVYIFAEIKPGMAHSAIDIYFNRMGEFLSIEGFRYNITTMSSVQESLKLIGL